MTRRSFVVVLAPLPVFLYSNAGNTSILLLYFGNYSNLAWCPHFRMTWQCIQIYEWYMYLVCIHVASTIWMLRLTLSSLGYSAESMVIPHTFLKKVNCKLWRWRMECKYLKMWFFYRETTRLQSLYACNGTWTRSFHLLNVPIFP